MRLREAEREATGVALDDQRATPNFDPRKGLKRLSILLEIVVRRRTLLGDDPVGIEESDVEVGALVALWLPYASYIALDL